jgi:predicted transcriptional regulator
MPLMADPTSRTPALEPRSRFGPLELRVLDALWSRQQSARVRDLQPDFPDIAYTTLMTTLDRLHRKGLLDRVPHGRAFAYRPRVSRAELQTGAVTQALRSLVDSGSSLEAILSFFVDEVGTHDASALDELERLIRERRRAMEESS